MLWPGEQRQVNYASDCTLPSPSSLNSQLKGEIVCKHSVRYTSVGGRMGLNNMPALILVGKEALRAQAGTERTKRWLCIYPNLGQDVWFSDLQFSHVCQSQAISPLKKCGMQHASIPESTSANYCCGVYFRRVGSHHMVLTLLRQCDVLLVVHSQYPSLRVNCSSPSANCYHFTPILPAIAIYPSKFRFERVIR